jgi:hypothetical protein
MLQRRDIFELADYSDALTEALENVTREILDNDVPECDYVMSHQFHHMNALIYKVSLKKPPNHKFRNAIRKVMVLNRRKELRVFKLIELITLIRQLKRKMANG